MRSGRTLCELVGAQAAYGPVVASSDKPNSGVPPEGEPFVDELRLLSAYESRLLPGPKPWDSRATSARDPYVG
ncbi:MAG: hypothetical protein Aurels2KO_50210 [Aureliella sp.]